MNKTELGLAGVLLGMCMLRKKQQIYSRQNFGFTTLNNNAN